ncbi:ABC-2 transporter permease [Sporosarcina newyorkensis]|uniref:ABC-2 type transport system permease protein n=1 Tax=Sporosarcina newyorkensis TaxID=759851 RepID=A0A1T4XHA9_9BACL|nr:ABC-2 transporter permease [Sporosarcina newyorkensis]SKA88992.1 ABC-2 type transport system permease protein [Sporosarcina newyorkensis]
MFNLIRRDVILQKRLLLTFIPFIAFFIIMDSHPALIFLVASIFIPFNAYGYDEKAETNILLNSLPYTRREIIASRYLGAIIYMILAIGVTSLALFALDKSFTMTDIAIGGGLFLLFSAFTFPLFHIFKPGNITTVVLIGFILLTGVVPPIVMFFAEHLTAITDFIVNVPTTYLYWGAAAIILVAYTVSWGVTTTIYQRKAF